MKILFRYRKLELKHFIIIIIILLIIGIFIFQSQNVTYVNIFTEKAFTSVKQKQLVYIDLKKIGNFERTLAINKEKDFSGKNGKAHYISEKKRNDAEHSKEEYGMNVVVSDEIPLVRSAPDTRNKNCKYWHYPTDLPKASVIIVFHNEGLSVLLRTVHMVLTYSPHELLEEVLLVDDFSDKEPLMQKLEEEISKLGSKVRLIRNIEREGLIRTRSRGAQEAKGEVIVFLDAHCEVNINWLVPLLTPIYYDYKTMTVPLIDGINHDTFEYQPVYYPDSHMRGIFEWGMLYKEKELPENEKKKLKYDSEPYPSPTHAGGLFAINREYFLSLGAYDPGLLIWGGENFELSFKIWQCGGKILWVPCSRVGHVYRSFMPYTFGKLKEKKKGPLIGINYKRVIEVWFDDEYKEYFYTREPLARYIDMGDIRPQLELKQKLKCKNFKWFMENVAYDMVEDFPYLPPNLFWGELKNLATENCLDTLGQNPPSRMGVSHCHGQGGSQLVRLNSKGQLSIGERCIDASAREIKLIFCKLGYVDGPWQYKEQKCMAVHPQTYLPSLLPCDPNNNFQHWSFHEIRPEWSTK